jgi:hypothetical protein
LSTSAELVTLVRDIIDLEESDLPTSLLRTYLRDGYDRVINLERRWPFFEVTYTFNTTANVRDYAISGIGSGDLREATSVVDTSMAGNRLRLISPDEAEAVWVGGLDQPSRPLFFTFWGSNLSLYPKPETVYAMKVRGYRKPTYTWVTDGVSQVDCDERLHTALAYYALSKSYERQEDPEMSVVYKRTFEEAVGLARAEIMRSSAHRPMILSGGRPYPSMNRWMQDLGRTLGQP